MARKLLRPTDLTVLVDTREQTPFDMTAFGYKKEVATLKTGDYSIKGLESDLVIERKSLSDFLGCVGKGRDRFERELKRMLEFKAKAVVVSASESEIRKGHWHYSKLTPKQVIGSYTGWMTWGIPFIFAPDHVQASNRAGHFLWLFARRHLSLDQCLKADSKRQNDDSQILAVRTQIKEYPDQLLPI